MDRQCHFVRGRKREKDASLAEDLMMMMIREKKKKK